MKTIRYFVLPGLISILLFKVILPDDFDSLPVLEQTHSCSTFMLDNGNSLLNGHNLDDYIHVPGLVVVNKRGVQKETISWNDLKSVTGKSRSAPRHKWTSKYGSITYNTFGKDFIDGGMNETGLYVGEMTLLGTEYPKNDALPKIYHHQWMQYLLDNFSTVQEAMEDLPFKVLCNKPYPREIDSLKLFYGYGQIELENEIISSLVKSKFKLFPEDTVLNHNGQKNKITDHYGPEIIIIDETLIQSYDPKVDSLAKFQQNGLSGLDLYTFNDFFNKNRISVKIDKIQKADSRITYMSRNDWNKIFDQGGWDYYHKIFGFIPTVSISRPGINKNKDKAFIYFDSISDKLGGAGFYVILEKINGQWIIRESILSWGS